MALHPQPSSIPSLESWTPGSLVRAVSQEKFYKNLLLKLLYKLKIVWRYSGTTDPPGCTLAARTLSLLELLKTWCA